VRFAGAPGTPRGRVTPNGKPDKNAMLDDPARALQSLLRLRELGCNMAQGYAVSRPLPADALLEWLRESPWARVAAQAA
jgi:hypothetical protein